MIFGAKKFVACIIMLFFSQPAIAWQIECIENQTTHNARIYNKKTPGKIVKPNDELYLNHLVYGPAPHIWNISEINEIEDKITISINQKILYFTQAKLIYCCAPIFGSTKFWLYEDNQDHQESIIQKIRAPFDTRKEDQDGHACYNLILEEKIKGTITCRLKLTNNGARESYGTID